MDTPMPEGVKNLIVKNVNEVEEVASTVDFVFSAVDMTKDEIRAIEEEYAKTETPVVSNNSAHRWTKDVPMVVPEINAAHFDLIKTQKERLGTTRGFIAVKTKLLNPELYTCTCSMERIWTKRSCCNNIPGNLRSRKDIQRLAGNDREYHSIHRRRRRKSEKNLFVYSEHWKTEKSNLQKNQRSHASA